MAVLTLSLGAPFTRQNSLSTSNIFKVNFAGLEDKYFPLQQHLNSFKCSCSLPGHWRGALVQGEEDAESIPAVKGLICRMMPNSLLGRREILSSKRPRAFAKVPQISCTLETFTAASWVTFSMGVFEIQGEVDPFSVLGAELCLVFLPCNIFPLDFCSPRWVSPNHSAFFLLVLKGLHPQSYLYLCL